MREQPLEAGPARWKGENPPTQCPTPLHGASPSPHASQLCDNISRVANVGHFKALNGEGDGQTGWLRGTVKLFTPMHGWHVSTTAPLRFCWVWQSGCVHTHNLPRPIFGRLVCVCVRCTRALSRGRDGSHSSGVLWLLRVIPSPSAQLMLITHS